MTAALFWLSVALLVHTYAGYPAVSWVLARLRRRCPRGREAVAPRVTVVIAAYNEGIVIGGRLKNILESDFPPRMIEVVVASDGSTDRTEEIVSRWAEPRVRLLRLPRGGRARAHNRAVAVAMGEIVVFTDARTSFDREFLRRVTEPFSDPRVGGVVGRLVYVTKAGTVAESTGAYWRFETKLREWESGAGLLVVGSGCCMAIRRSLYRELRPDEDVDDATPLDLVYQGYRVVFAPEAVAYDVPPATPGDEIRARARMTILALTAILRRRALLNPLRFPGVAFALYSHRVLRALTPGLLLGVFLTNMLLLGVAAFYRVPFAAQLCFYALALLGWLGGKAGWTTPILRIPLSFCVWNIGFGAGLIRVVRGETVASYAPV